MNETESAATLSPQQLARAYDRFVSARWRGEDEAADPVAMWFEAHWVSEPSPEPETPPAGASVLGASGRGIHWYARGDQLLGYVPGHDEGCYRVAAGETMPALTSPWDIAPSPRATDRLVHLASEARLIDEESPATAHAELRAGTVSERRLSDRLIGQMPARNHLGASTPR